MSDGDLTGGLKPLGVLEALAEMRQPATLAQLVTYLSVPKPTVHRWLKALESVGLLSRHPDGRRYEIAARATQLAIAVLLGDPGRALRRDILRRLVNDVGEACNLTIFEGMEVTYLDRVEANWPLRISFQPGSRVPAHASASGKLFLAYTPPSRREKLLRQIPLKRFTESTLTSAGTLRRELQTIRRLGYSTDREEYIDGLVCVAAPVFNTSAHRRSCVAALAIQAPVTRTSIDALVKFVPRLQQGAAEIAATFEGW
jgi:IclR family transcriptional regulator, acetate operon repressor